MFYPLWLRDKRKCVKYKNWPNSVILGVPALVVAPLLFNAWLSHFRKRSLSPALHLLIHPLRPSVHPSVSLSSWAKKNLSHRSCRKPQRDARLAFYLMARAPNCAWLWCVDWWTLPPVIERNFSSSLFKSCVCKCFRRSIICTDDDGPTFIFAVGAPCTRKVILLIISAE